MFRKYGVYLAWLLSCIGVLVSLYFSEVLHDQPCNLCWYQRIALFPLAIILGVAAYTGDRKAIRYALPLVVIGFCFAIYQIAIQEIPDWNPLDFCGGGPSCAEKKDIGLGPISLPMLSASAFASIAFLLIGVWHRVIKDVWNK